MHIKCIAEYLIGSSKSPAAVWVTALATFKIHILKITPIMEKYSHWKRFLELQKNGCDLLTRSEFREWNGLKLRFAAETVIQIMLLWLTIRCYYLSENLLICRGHVQHTCNANVQNVISDQLFLSALSLAEWRHSDVVNIDRWAATDRSNIRYAFLLLPAAHKLYCSNDGRTQICIKHVHVCIVGEQCNACIYRRHDVWCALSDVPPVQCNRLL